MALNKPQLVLQLKHLYQEMRSHQNPNDDYFANRMADIIETFVKSGTVNTVVTTTGGNGTGVGQIT